MSNSNLTICPGCPFPWECALEGCIGGGRIHPAVSEQIDAVAGCLSLLQANRSRQRITVMQQLEYAAAERGE